MWDGNWKWATGDEFDEFIKNYDGGLVVETVDGVEYYHDYTRHDLWDSVVAEKSPGFDGEYVYKIYHDYDKEMSEYLNRFM